MQLPPARSRDEFGWYVIFTNGVSYAMRSLPGGRDRAIASACRLLEQGHGIIEVGQIRGFVNETIDSATIEALCRERYAGCEVGPVGSSNSEKVSELRDEMRARGRDVLTPTLLAAFLGALALIVIPGDQTGAALALLGKAAGLWTYGLAH